VTPTSSRAALTTLSWLVLAGFALTLALVVLLPLYTDEITATMEAARPFAEGARTFRFLPQCTKSWQAPLALVWYPAAGIYYAVFARLGVLGYRISSLVVAALWLGAVAWGVTRSTRRRDARVRRLATFVAPLAVGALPLALVTARQEPVMTVSLCVYLGLPLFAPIETRRTVAGRAVVTCAFALATSVFTFLHTKSLLFTPVILVSLFFTFSRRRPAWLAAALVATGAALLAAYVRARVGAVCDEAPKVQAVLRSLSSDPMLLFRDPVAFAHVAFDNVRHLAEGVRLEPERQWLPHDDGGNVPFFVKLADESTQALLTLFVVVAPAAVLAIAARTFRRRRTRVPLALALALLITVFAVLVMTKIWAFYSSPLVVATLAFALALAAFVAPLAAPVRLRRRLRPYALAGACILHIVILANLATTLLYIGPRLVRYASREGTVVPGQPASVPAFGFEKERAKIRDRAAACGIRGDGASRLVVDDATVFAFDDLKEPLHLIYVSDDTLWGVDLTGNQDLVFLRKLGTPGIVSRCAYFPTRLVAKAKRAGDYCCVGARELDPAPLASGERIVFGAGGNDEAFLVAGWSWPETAGRWSIGERSTIQFLLAPGSTATSVRLEASSALSSGRRTQDLDVLLNGTVLGTVHFDDDTNDVERARRLPIASARLSPDQPNELELRPHDVRTPRMLDVANDDRPLGVWLRSLWID
jgi:hypothetical protein